MDRVLSRIKDGYLSSQLWNVHVSGLSESRTSNVECLAVQECLVASIDLIPYHTVWDDVRNVQAWSGV